MEPHPLLTEVPQILRAVTEHILKLLLLGPLQMLVITLLLFCFIILSALWSRITFCFECLKVRKLEPRMLKELPEPSRPSISQRAVGNHSFKNLSFLWTNAFVK